ncbi:hypothetical protein [Mesorhizobium sp. M0088]|uniref:COG3904 family protein n=1 Tax=Mesorhizobium sp. M0088 TaxID=2956873 RepID=UPI00333AEA3B
MRLLAVIVLLSLVAVCSLSSLVIAGTPSFGPFTVDLSEPTVIRMSGEIDAEDALNFRRALQYAPQARLVVLDSPGGSVYAGLLIADDVFEHKLSTVIPSGASCMSACSLIFFAGLERQAHGKLGVHQMTGGGATGTQLAVSDIIELMTRFEVPADVLAIMFRTPAETVYIFSDEEIARFNINRSARVPDGKFGDYPLASCSGWNGTLTKSSGQNGRNARMSGIVTEPDLVEYCERDPGGETIRNGGTKTVGECAKELAYEMNTRMRTVANCESGVLRFFYGSKPERTMKLPLPDDRSCASGLPPLIDQFQMLCPRMAQRYDLQH